jgi:two-component system phosphate regulon sensor histidine kinase PhoR
LTENAIKYGKEQGTVTLQVDVDKDNIVVRVKDDGPGISSEHLSRIFERFYRVEKSRSRDMGGIGLGLAIVKQILEAHNTQIRVQSELGQGTEFVFLLKKQKPSAVKKTVQDDAQIPFKNTKGL